MADAAVCFTSRIPVGARKDQIHPPRTPETPTTLARPLIKVLAEVPFRGDLGCGLLAGLQW